MKSVLVTILLFFSFNQYVYADRIYAPTYIKCSHKTQMCEENPYFYHKPGEFIPVTGTYRFIHAKSWNYDGDKSGRPSELDYFVPGEGGDYGVTFYGKPGIDADRSLLGSGWGMGYLCHPSTPHWDEPVGCPFKFN